MIPARMFPLVVKQIVRKPLRSMLTIGGVAVSMFLYSASQSMHAGVRAATELRAGDTTLVVYRKDRYCPATSNMPQSYEQELRRIDGVRSVVPMKIVVNNCRAALDVVTFRGVPRDEFARDGATRFTLIAGSVEDWTRRSDAALVGETLANRRRVRVGQQLSAAGVNAYVAGIVRSSEPQDQNVAYVHLDFLQFASGSRAGGLVTQFNVQVSDSSQLDAVARRIDETFASSQSPTRTSPEKSFVAGAAADAIEIVGFMRWLGLACLGAVLALIANAIILSVQDRIREHAVLQTLGYRGSQIAGLIMCEGLMLALIGGGLGCLASMGFLSYSSLALSVESQSIPIVASPAIFASGLLVAATLGVLAGMVPAIQASRREIVSCFRAV
ncbi:MAG: ABC transporter permease [Phycisphaerae bacterium]